MRYGECFGRRDGMIHTARTPPDFPFTLRQPVVADLIQARPFNLGVFDTPLPRPILSRPPRSYRRDASPSTHVTQDMTLVDSIDPAVFRTAAIALAVSGTFALARILFRHKPPAALTEQDMAVLTHRVRNYDTAAAAFAVVAAIGVGVGFWAACRAAAAEWDRAMPAHAFLYRTTSGESPDWLWALPAGFTALIGAYWGHVLAIRVLFGRDGLAAWLLVCNHKAGFDGHRFLAALSVLTVGGSLVTAGMLLDYYTRVEEDRFVENDLFGLGERSRPYADVTKVAVTTHTRGRDGAESEQSRLRVYFSDGAEWTASPAEAYRPLAEFLARRTGKPLLNARHAEDLAKR